MIENERRQEKLMVQNFFNQQQYSLGWLKSQLKYSIDQ